MTELVEYEIYCNGEFVAEVSGIPAEAAQEAKRYGAIYSGDGEITYMQVTRKEVYFV